MFLKTKEREVNNMNILTLTNLSKKGNVKIDIHVQEGFDQLIKQSQTLQFKLAVKCGNELQWDDLIIFNYSKDERHYEYNDIAVENNTRYEYSIKLINSSNLESIDEQTIITSFEGAV